MSIGKKLPPYDPPRTIKSCHSNEEVAIRNKHNETARSFTPPWPLYETGLESEEPRRPPLLTETETRLRGCNHHTETAPSFTTGPGRCCKASDRWARDLDHPVLSVPRLSPAGPCCVALAPIPFPCPESGPALCSGSSTMSLLSVTSLASSPQLGSGTGLQLWASQPRHQARLPKCRESSDSFKARTWSVSCSWSHCVPWERPMPFPARGPAQAPATQSAE